MPEMKTIYDLAYLFRNEKIWTKVFEDEIFAAELPDGTTAYCNVMGRGGEHRAVSVYLGEEAFASTFWPLLDGTVSSQADLFLQDCIQCSIEKKEQFDPEELDMVHAYCDVTGTTFRTPYPQFTRYSPRCVPWRVREESDWTAIRTVLQILHLMFETIKREGKDALRLNPVHSSAGEENGQIDVFGESLPGPPAVEQIPRYTIENGELRIGMTELPPRMERITQAPDRFNAKKIDRLTKKKQSGVLECEITLLPEPVAGEPPYFPSVLLAVNAEDGMILSPAIMQNAQYDPNQAVDSFLDVLLKDDVYPERIKVRTAETKTLLEPFCGRTRIWLDETDRMPALDEVKSNMMGEMEEDGPDDDISNHINDIAAMLSQLSISEIRTIPAFVLREILAAEDLFPPEIAEKLRKALK